MDIINLTAQYERIMEDLRFIQVNGDHDQNTDPEERSLKLVADLILARRERRGAGTSLVPVHSVSVDDR
jgi:hypothetical protein